MANPYLLLGLSKEETDTLYNEVIAGLITTETACEKSSDTDLIPRLMRRIATLNAIEERMEPHITLPQGKWRTQHPERDPKRIPSGNR